MKPASEKIRGIDSIRFVCALWVVFGHLGSPSFPLERTPGLSLANLLRGGYNSLFDGPAAVIVFFLISGFCIHFPYRLARQIPVAEFFCRRYIRIGVPLLVASVLAAWLQVPALLIQPTSLVLSLDKVRHIEDTDIGVIWSLVCEMIFYALYPLLFRLIRQHGWSLMFATTYGLAFLVIAMRPAAHSYPAYGNLLTWVLGLPCWLLGCRLAETLQLRPFQPVAPGKIWTWRMAVWVVSALCLLLRFHTPVGYPWSLTVFGVLCYFWLKLELQYFTRAAPFNWLEWCGTWSYSVYLGHKLACPFLAKCGWTIPEGELASVFFWLFRTFLVLVFCLTFSKLFEFPAHQLARWAGRSIARAGRLGITT